MKTSLKQFLTDLYDIDPALKSHELELIPLIEKLLANDPAQAPDAAFVSRLRMQLQDRVAGDVSIAPAGSFFQKFLFAIGGAVTAAVILPVAFIAMKGGTPTFTSTESDGAALFSYSVTDAGKNAFGDLTGLGAGSPADGRGMGGGAEPATAIATAPAMAPEAQNNAAVSDMAVGSDAKMIAPYPMTRYEYVYDGAYPELSAEVAVYKRNTTGKSLPLSALGSSLNLGTIDLTSFSGMNIDSLSFSQNKPYGYQMTVNLRDSSVSLDAQWDQWPMSKCQTDACYQAERVKLTDIPSDEDLIAAAKGFVKDHGIDVTHYGEPEVDMQWKRDYERTTDKSQAYIPDQIRVIFPLMIDGHEVSDQSGFATGISVGVHVKTRRVMNVYGLMSRDYTKSSYAGVSDSNEIKKYLSTLDNYAWMPEADMAKATKATVTLGEPVLGYSVYYTYKDNANQELLIPSLIFPIKEVTGGDQFFYRNTVVVPLAAEMFKQQTDPGRPMPMDGVRAM